MDSSGTRSESAGYSPTTTTHSAFRISGSSKRGGTVFGPFNQVGVGPDNSEFFATVFDTTVEFDYISSGRWGDVTSFNGYYIDDIFRTADEIVGVEVIGTTNFAFTQDRLSWTGDRILLDFGGLTFDPSSTLAISVTFVPSPPGTAFLGLGLIATRRRRCAEGPTARGQF